VELHCDDDNSDARAGTSALVPISLPGEPARALARPSAHEAGVFACLPTKRVGPVRTTL